MPVTLHVWRVPPRRVPAAMLLIGLGRLRRPSGVRFAKFLGTGTGDSFGLGDADLTRYAAVTVAERDVRFSGWDRVAVSSARVELEPLVSRGRWSGVEPFRPSGAARDAGGMVLALTRARLRPSRAMTFWRAIPAVAAELASAPGLLARFGIGEAPIGWQGTVSLWRDATDLTRFAYRQPEHRAVIARTPVDRWYAEELFARFAVLRIEGDRGVLGWLGEEDEGTQAKR
ncbi:monooxygenase [Actinoplanes sp. NPDC051411]|uniref:monooxygenase n=1 Tax=Actinoplanes sp. NPDC051411 TaxID=3155522 RepID=UPI00342A751F